MPCLFPTLVAAMQARMAGDEAAAGALFLDAVAKGEDTLDMEARIIAAFSARFLHTYHNGTRAGHGIGRNGEALVLRRLAPFAPAVLFDVGANVGAWTLEARTAIPQAAVHAFEIFPDTFERLAAAVEGAAGISLNPFGLLDRDGTAQVHHDPGVDSVFYSTLADGWTGRSRPCPVLRGDTYMARHGIERIDFLKIDVEGAESGVLAGFAGALERGAVTAIQFEYGPAALSSRFLLKDFYTLLRGAGFAVGRLYTGGVMFKEYAIADESFVNANFVACLESRPDLIDALALRP